MDEPGNIPAFAVRWLCEHPRLAMPSSAQQTQYSWTEFQERLADAWQLLPHAEFNNAVTSIWQNDPFRGHALLGWRLLTRRELVLHLLGPNGLWPDLFPLESNLVCMGEQHLILQLRPSHASDLYLSVLESQVQALSEQAGANGIQIETQEVSGHLHCTFSWQQHESIIDRVKHSLRGLWFGEQMSVEFANLYRLIADELNITAEATTNKTAEAQPDRSRYSNQRNHEFLHQLPVAAIIASEDWQILAANEQAQNLISQQGEVFTNRTINDLTGSPSTQARLEQAASAGSEASAVDVSIPVENGSLLPTEWRVSVTPERTWLCTFLSKAEEHRDKQTINALREQLLQCQRLTTVGRMTSGIAHDFNNLLVAINGYSSMMLEDGVTDLGMLRDIQDAGKQAELIARQLLDYSRSPVEAESPESHDLQQIVAETMPLIRHIVDDGIEIRFEASAETYQAITVPDQLQQVLINLVINARDALNGTGRVEISLDNGNQSDEVLLEISDNGMGMSEAIAERAFDPLFSTKGQAGTGLGLAQAQQIIRDQGGSIQLFTKPGEGTRVVLSLQRAPIAATSVNQSESWGAPDGTETIIIADHSQAARETSALILKAAGYQVIKAEHGDEVMRLLNEHPEVALVFADTALAGLGGESLYGLCRDNVHFLLTSSLPLTAPHNQFVTASGARFVAKPFDRQVLRQAVRHAIDQPSQPAEAGAQVLRPTG